MGKDDRVEEKSERVGRVDKFVVQPNIVERKSGVRSPLSANASYLLKVVIAWR